MTSLEDILNDLKYDFVQEVISGSGRVKHNPAYISSVVCCECGMRGTLYKQKDGTYICKNCKEKKRKWKR